MNAFRSLENKGLLVIPHMRVQNANAISSPLTHGFPSITAFLGLMWALERKLAEADIPLALEQVGVICHWHEEQVQDGYVKTFRLTRNPIDKDGSTAAIVEEGRIHLDITLIFQVDGGGAGDENNVVFQNPEQRQKLAWTVRDMLAAMRIAGGTVVPHRPAPGRSIKPDLQAIPTDADEREAQFRLLRRCWLPGFALVSRDDLLQQRLQQMRAQDPNTTLLDAWLDLSRFNYRSRVDDKGDGDGENEGKKKDKVIWAHDRPAGSGWIVPIPVGYGALSEVHVGGSVTNARDADTPFRFVESLYSIGQWVSPHRLASVRDLLWYARSETENHLYRCCNDHRPPAEPATAQAPASTAEPV